MFGNLGIDIVDTDIVAKEVVESGSSAINEIHDAFGDGVIAADGSLDRAAMRDIIFNDAEKRKQLEGILHPRIRDASFRQVKRATGPYVIVVVPLLFNSSMKEAMHRILVVDCTEETQIERLMMRDNESREQAHRILAAQASRKERLSIADDVIGNDDDIESVWLAVTSLHQSYLERAGQQTG